MRANVFAIAIAYANKQHTKQPVHSNWIKEPEKKKFRKKKKLTKEHRIYIFVTTDMTLFPEENYFGIYRGVILLSIAFRIYMSILRTKLLSFRPSPGIERLSTWWVFSFLILINYKNNWFCTFPRTFRIINFINRFFYLCSPGCKERKKFQQLGRSWSNILCGCRFRPGKAWNVKTNKIPS